MDLCNMKVRTFGHMPTEMCVRWYLHRTWRVTIGSFEVNICTFCDGDGDLSDWNLFSVDLLNMESRLMEISATSHLSTPMSQKNLCEPSFRKSTLLGSSFVQWLVSQRKFVSDQKWYSMRRGRLVRCEENFVHYEGIKTGTTIFIRPSDSGSCRGEAAKRPAWFGVREFSPKRRYIIRTTGCEMAPRVCYYTVPVLTKT